MQVSTKQLFTTQINNLADLQNSVADIQQKILTGKQIAVPSDDPIGYTMALNLRAEKASTEQFSANIKSASARLTLQDTVLAQTANSVTRLQELAIQGASDTMSAADRKSVALEMSQIKSSLVDLGNTVDSNGDYIFGGYRSKTPPFTADSTGNITYTGDSNRQEVGISASAKMVVSSTGAEIFMSIHIPGQDAPASIFDMADKAIAMLNNNKSVTASTSEFKASIDHLSNYQAITGARLSRLDSQMTLNDSTVLNVSTNLSLIEDSNIEQLVTELKQKLNSIEAGNASFTKIVGTTLFDYLR